MIICRTPLRISFFGGGTDYPIWYREHGGAVISTTINKYSYLTVRKLPPFFDYKYRVRYFKQEFAETVGVIEHPAVRECIKFLNLSESLEIAHNSDLPARSGLGSSSSFTVGLLHSLHAMRYYMPTKRELALQALEVEQEWIRESVGSQDQVAAAFGGLNHIQFDHSRQFDVDPIIVSPQRLRDLQASLLLCFTGFARTASDIASSQIRSVDSLDGQLSSMKELCDEAYQLLTSMNGSLDEFGKLLGNQWEIKRSLTDAVSTPEINDIYETAISNGALGGKLLGAGGGGFFLFYAPPKYHNRIKTALGDKMFVPFRFESTGSKIVYVSHE